MAQINVRVDDVTKKNVEAVCSALGLSMSTAIIMYLKQISREKRLPLTLSVDPFYSEENMAELRRRISKLESGKAPLVLHDIVEAYNE